MEPEADEPRRHTDDVTRRGDGLTALKPTHSAISCFSAGVRIRCDCPRYAGESWPGIHGGIRPSFVITRMPLAWAFADFADRSEKGAIPPGVWQPAHFSAKIGATLDHVGAATWAARRALEPPEPPAAIVVAPIATIAAKPSPRASLLRFTDEG